MIAVTRPRCTPAAAASTSAFVRASPTASRKAFAWSFSWSLRLKVGPYTWLAPACDAASRTIPADDTPWIVTSTELLAV